MMMQMVGAFAEFERAMLKERTKAGLDAARQDGRIGGRRPKLSPQQQAEIRKMVSKGGKTAADAARLFKVHPATVSRLLGREPVRHQGRPRMPNNVDDFMPSNSESDRWWLLPCANCCDCCGNIRVSRSSPRSAKPPSMVSTIWTGWSA